DRALKDLKGRAGRGAGAAASGARDDLAVQQDEPGDAVLGPVAVALGKRLALGGVGPSLVLELLGDGPDDQASRTGRGPGPTGLGGGVQPRGGARGDVVEAGLVGPGQQAPPGVRGAAVGAGRPQVEGEPALEGGLLGPPAEALVVAVAHRDDPARPSHAAEL